jgi:hypothetical protein
MMAMESTMLEFTLGMIVGAALMGIATVLGIKAGERRAERERE